MASEGGRRPVTGRSRAVTGRARAVTRSGSGDRLPRRAGARDGDDDQGEDRQEDEQDHDKAATGHRRRLPRPRTGSNRSLARAKRGWFERNRTWLLPYLSALFVVVVEVLAAFTKPLPESAHLVLAAFWAFAVQRGVNRQRTAVAVETRLAAFAAKHHMPVESLRDEFTAFQATMKALPPGDPHDD